MPHARLVYLYANVVLLRILRCLLHECVAVAKADLEAGVCIALKQVLKFELSLCEFKAELGP